ncbi:MAG TPA: c-type cytochrome domain-containing protein, partial [Blastocatellia bacterium]|nr:c-type cytochrome domain-containing protein [Blastocatellia bacterium]
MKRILKACILLGAFSLAIFSLPQTQFFAAKQTQKTDFVRDIEPIFAASCYSCHGAKKAAGQLRLDTKELAMKGGMSGQIIIAGNSKDSRLMHRILGLGGEKQMPLGADPLKPEQIELIRRWIDEGANWPETLSEKAKKQENELPKHWAYVKPIRPSLPEVKNRTWVRNAIDNFVLARL